MEDLLLRQVDTQDGRKVCRPINIGETLEPTDYYLNKSGTWQVVPCPALEVKTNKIEFLRPVQK